MASSYRNNGFLVLMMVTFFMGLTTSHNSPLGSPSPSPQKLSSSSPSPLFVHPPITNSPSPAPSSKVKSPASPPSPKVVSPVPEISAASQSPSSHVAPQPATNDASTFNFNTRLTVGSVAALISAFAFLA